VGDTTTNTDGLAESTLTLGPSPGTNRVEVTAADIPTTVTFDAIAEIVSNHPPVATDDLVATSMDTAVEFNILANDYDPDGDILSMTNHVDPMHGTLTCDYDTGQCQYTPDEGFIGTDSFAYEISDSFFTATGTVTIMVNELSALHVALDIKPRTCPNRINIVVSHGRVCVAVLGGVDFDVTDTYEELKVKC